MISLRHLLKVLLQTCSKIGWIITVLNLNIKQIKAMKLVPLAFVSVCISKEPFGHKYCSSVFNNLLDNYFVSQRIK